MQLPFLQDEQTQAVEQQERISKAVKHCIESCKCSPGLGACQLTKQFMNLNYLRWKLREEDLLSSLVT